MQCKHKEIETLGGVSDEVLDEHVDELNNIEMELYACPAEGLADLRIKAEMAERRLDTYYTDELTEAAIRSVLNAVKALPSTEVAQV